MPSISKCSQRRGIIEHLLQFFHVLGFHVVTLFSNALLFDTEKPLLILRRLGGLLARIPSRIHPSLTEWLPPSCEWLDLAAKGAYQPERPRESCPHQSLLAHPSADL